MAIITKRHKAVVKRKCDICEQPFVLGQSFERITTHSHRELIIHTECICGKGEK